VKAIYLCVRAGGSVEAVLIPMLHRRGSRKHITLCVSSQVGCAMNCQFCYTGRMGLSGNLSTAQIIEQVRAVLGFGLRVFTAVETAVLQGVTSANRTGSTACRQDGRCAAAGVRHVRKYSWLLSAWFHTCLVIHTCALQGT
jgi:hypothetical protein